MAKLTRSVLDVRPVELAGYRQRHFFAGISVWPYASARRLASRSRGMDRILPMPAFLAAGKREGFADERHLWSGSIIDQRRPSTSLANRLRRRTDLLGD